MRTKLRLAAAALPIALLLAFTGSTASTAQTTSAPVLTYWDCDPGGSLMFCSILAEGGTAPYTYQWYKNYVLKPQFTGHVMRIGCTPNQYVRIDVTLTDASGQQITAWAVCMCVRDWQ